MSFFATLASGSSGNAALLSDGKTHILIDAGVSCKRLCAAIRTYSIDPGEISAVLVTHDHGDHIAGLDVFSKYYGAPVYASRGACRHLALLPRAAKRLRLIDGSSISFGGVNVTVFDTSHDAEGSVGFRFDAGGLAVGYFTDSGCVTASARRALAGVDILVIESNYDRHMLVTGDYPYYLQRRIMSETGHLSNDACAEYCCEMLAGGARRFLLAHLSENNNTPNTAFSAVKSALTGMGAAEGRDFTLSVAPRHEAGPPELF